MSNPFKSEGAMLPIASINQHVVYGKKANDLFRPELIYRDLIGIQKKHELEMETHDFQEFLKTLFDIDDPVIHQDVVAVGYKYGEALARIILSLVRPDEHVKNENLRWKEEHWNYWQRMTSIYLMGGIASSVLHPLFTEKIDEILKEEHLDNIKVTIIPSSQEKALDGMLQRYDKGHFLLFDFGQTMIKRAYVIRIQGLNTVERKLHFLPAKFLEIEDDIHLLAHAYELERYIEDVIISSMNEVKDQNCEILISMANYVKKGELHPGRRSYGMLSTLSKNYQTYLSEQLSFRLQKKISVMLIHDATAMSYVVPQVPHTAVMTLGTAFGIAFIDE